MKEDPHCGESARVQKLDWDTKHYGFSVARILGQPSDLSPLLGKAAEERIRFAYYLAPAACSIDESLLENYSGRHVGGQVRYRVRLSDLDRLQVSRNHEVEVYSGPADDRALLKLGVAAGQQSRFRVDTRLSDERCDALYEAWTRNSVNGDMADEVLVARVNGSLAALVTIRCRQRVAVIGLVATDPVHRGCGIASAVLDFAHSRMAHLGMEYSEVVTQSENKAARGLYERFNYHLVEQGEHYHFMPLGV